MVLWILLTLIGMACIAAPGVWAFFNFPLLKRVPENMLAIRFLSSTNKFVSAHYGEGRFHYRWKNQIQLVHPNRLPQTDTFILDTQDGRTVDLEAYWTWVTPSGNFIEFARKFDAGWQTKLFHWFVDTLTDLVKASTWELVTTPEGLDKLREDVLLAQESYEDATTYGVFLEKDKRMTLAARVSADDALNFHRREAFWAQNPSETVNDSDSNQVSVS